MARLLPLQAAAGGKAASRSPTLDPAPPPKVRTWMAAFPSDPSRAGKYKMFFFCFKITDETLVSL